MGTESKRLLRPRYDPFQPIQEHIASCTQKVTPLDFRRAEFATCHGFREEALTHARHSAEGSTNVYHHSLKSELCRKGAAAHRDILEGGFHVSRSNKRIENMCETSTTMNGVVQKRRGSLDVLLA